MSGLLAHLSVVPAVASPPPTGTPFVAVTNLGAIQTDSNAFGVGFQFQIAASNITVTSLGRWKVVGDSKVHFLGLTDNSAALLSGGGVNVNMTNTADADGYVYAALAAPIVLTAGVTYRIYGGQNSDFVDHYYNETCTLGTTSVATILNATYAGPDFPAGSVGTNGTVGGGGASYGPVNFKYT